MLPAGCLPGQVVLVSFPKLSRAYPTTVERTNVAAVPTGHVRDAAARTLGRDTIERRHEHILAQ